MTGGKHTHTHTHTHTPRNHSLMSKANLMSRVAFSQRWAPSLQNQISMIIFVRNYRCLCMNFIKTNTRKPQRDERDEWRRRELRLWDSSRRISHRGDKTSSTVTEIKTQTLQCSFSFKYNKLNFIPADSGGKQHFCSTFEFFALALPFNATLILNFTTFQSSIFYSTPLHLFKSFSY